MFLLRNMLLPLSRDGHQNPALMRQDSTQFSGDLPDQSIISELVYFLNVFVEHSEAFRVSSVSGVQQRIIGISNCLVGISEWKGWSLFPVNQRDINQSQVPVISCVSQCSPLSVFSCPMKMHEWFHVSKRQQVLLLSKKWQLANHRGDWLLLGWH